MFFEDLSEAEAEGDFHARVVHMGWLDDDHPFQSGPTSTIFQQALLLLCENPAAVSAGFHLCPFCPAGSPPAFGSSVIEVPGPPGEVFSAPSLIHHYVVAHGYAPPESFQTAVVAVAARAKDTRGVG